MPFSSTRPFVAQNAGWFTPIDGWIVLGLRRHPGLAEPVHQALEVAAVGRDHRPVAVLSVEDAVAAGEPAADGESGHDSGEALPAPALLHLADRPGLRHGPEVLVDGRHGGVDARDAERDVELLLVESEQLACSDRRGEGVVALAPDLRPALGRGLDRDRDPVADLVAEHDRGEKVSSAGVDVLPERQTGGDRRMSRMEHVVEHVLVVQREAEVRVGIGSRGNGDAGPVADDRRALLAAAEVLRELDVQLADPRLEAAEAGADDVQAREAGGVHDVVGEVLEPGAGDERRELARRSYDGSSRP